VLVPDFHALLCSNELTATVILHSIDRMAHKLFFLA
jgi:hypothetical protein